MHVNPILLTVANRPPQVPWAETRRLHWIPRILLVGLTVFAVYPVAQVASARPLTDTGGAKDIYLVPSQPGNPDLTVAFSVAMRTCGRSAGCLIHVPVGDWTIDRTIIVPDVPIHIEGASRHGSRLKIMNSAQASFSVIGVEPFEMSDLLVYAGTPRLADAYVRIDPGAGRINYYSNFHNVTFEGSYDGIAFVRAAHFVVEGSVFSRCGHACLAIENLTNEDSGDGAIYGNLFQPTQNGTGIVQHSSGGLKVATNKFAGGAYGFLLDFDIAANNTSILWFTGNSVEGADHAGIRLQRRSVSGMFGLVHIADNEIALAPIAIDIDGSGWLNDVAIDDNALEPSPGGTAVKLRGGLNIHARGNDLIGTGKTTTGYEIARGVSGDVAMTGWHDIAIPFADASAGSMIHIKKLVSGRAIANTGSSRGRNDFYSANYQIDFPVSLPTAPTMSFTITNAATGGLAVMQNTSSTKTGVSVKVVGTAPSASIAFDWTAATD